MEIESERKRLGSANALSKNSQATPQRQTAATKLQAVQRGRSGRQLNADPPPRMSETLSEHSRSSRSRRAAKSYEAERAKLEQKRKVEQEKQRQQQEQKAAEQAAAAKAVHTALREAKLIQAATAGNADECRQLLAEGISVEACDSNGRTALHLAALNDHTETILVLLDAGIDIDARDACGMTPVSIAAQAGKTEALCVLVDDGADVELAAATSAYKMTPIMFAAKNGHADAIGA